MAKSNKPKEETIDETPQEREANAQERADRESITNADIATRTSRYDQDLKERAHAVGINPDNFEEEHVLGEAVKKAEEEAEATNSEENTDEQQ